MNNVTKSVITYDTQRARRLRRPVHCRGQTLVEYALILAFVSIVAVGVLINLQTSVTKIYTSINNNLIVSAATH